MMDLADIPPPLYEHLEGTVERIGPRTLSGVEKGKYRAASSLDDIAREIVYFYKRTMRMMEFEMSHPLKDELPPHIHSLIEEKVNIYFISHSYPFIDDRFLLNNTLIRRYMFLSMEQLLSQQIP